MLLYSNYMNGVRLKWKRFFFLLTLFCFDPHMQFPIQLVATWTIDHAQGLLMGNLTFDPHGVFRHGLTYIALTRIQTKENLYLFNPLQQKKFSVDVMVKEETNKLETKAKYELSLSILKNFQSLYLIIQFLSTWSLNQHYHDIISNPNLQASHILCCSQRRGSYENRQHIHYLMWTLASMFHRLISHLLTAQHFQDSNWLPALPDSLTIQRLTGTTTQ